MPLKFDIKILPQVKCENSARNFRIAVRRPTDNTRMRWCVFYELHFSSAGGDIFS
jgi:hypothetical protein